MRDKKRKHGFTLVELLIVICVIGILFVVLISRVDFTTDKARTTGVQSDFRAFQTAAHQVAVEDGKLVDDLNLLAEKLNSNLDATLQVHVENNTLKTDAIDPWGTPYEIRYSRPVNTKGQTAIISAGPDLTFNTKDDISTAIICEKTDDGTNILIKDNVDDFGGNVPEGHVCIFDQQNMVNNYIQTNGNCATKTIYYYSCLCGAIGTTTFEGEKVPEIHINDVKYEYRYINENQHEKKTLCKGCNSLLNTEVEIHNIVNNQCSDCKQEMHSHNYNQQNTSIDYQKAAATCTAKAVYYYSCSCGAKSVDTFEYGEMLEHNFAEIVEEKFKKDDATCIAKATYYYSCSLCEFKNQNQTFSTGSENKDNHVGNSTIQYIYLNAESHTIKNICSACNGVISSAPANHMFDVNNNCTACNEHVHQYTQQVISEKYLNTSATCTTKATYFYKCVGCEDTSDEIFETGDFANHIWVNKQDDRYLKVEATCTTYATYYKSCSYCNVADTETFDGTTLNSNKHGVNKYIYSYLDVNTHEKKTVCFNCGVQIATTTNENHIFNALNTCTLCDNHMHSYTVKAIENHYIRTAATCTSPATYYYKCIGCSEYGDLYYEIGDTLPHSYTNVLDSKYEKVAPTCVDYGVYYKSCANCEAQSTETFTSPLLDTNNHIGNSYKICSDYDEIYHLAVIKCNSCKNTIETNYEKHEMNSKNTCITCSHHTHQFDQKTNQQLMAAATCTTKTTYFYECLCGMVGDTYYEIGNVNSSAHWGEIVNVGEQSIHTKYSCCNKTESTKHNYKTTIEIPATCTTIGTTKYTCECGYSYTSKNIAIISHDESAQTQEYLKSVATCTKSAVYYNSCSMCGKKGTTTYEYGTFGHVEVFGGTVDVHIKCSVCNTILSNTHDCKTSVYEVATCNKMGSTKHECECGYYYIIQDLDALGHIDENNDNKCDRCPYIAPGLYVTNSNYISKLYTWEDLITDGYLDETGKARGGSYSKDADVVEILNGDLVLPENFTVPSYAFTGCKKITSVVYQYGTTSTGFAAFESCSSLQEVTLSETITSIDNYCFDTSGVKQVNWGDSKVTKIGTAAFEMCRNLVEITFPDTLISISMYAFDDCSNLKTLNLGNGITKLGFGFDNLAIEYVYIPKQVTSCGTYPFMNCKDLKEIVVDPENTKYASLDGVFYNKSLTNLIQYPLGSEREIYVMPETVTNVYDHACANAVNLKEVVFNDSIVTIERYGFYNCDKLEKINLPSSLSQVGLQAFQSCALKELTLNEGLISVEEDAFGENYFETINIPSTLVSIHATSFNSSFLKNFYVDDNNLAYTDYEGALYSKDLTKLVACPNGRYEFVIPDFVTTIGTKAFSFCHKVKRIVIGKNVTTLESSAFEELYGIWEICNLSSIDIQSVGSLSYYVNYWTTDINDTNLYKTDDGLVFYYGTDKYGTKRYYLVAYDGTDEHIVVPETFNGNNYLVNGYAFLGTSFTSIEILHKPSSSSNQRGYDFSYCYNLERVIIGEGLYYHPDFTACKNIQSVTYLSVVPLSINESMFTVVPTLYIPKDTYTIYVQQNPNMAQYFVEIE